MDSQKATSAGTRQRLRVAAGWKRMVDAVKKRASRSATAFDLPGVHAIDAMRSDEVESL